MGRRRERRSNEITRGEGLVWFEDEVGERKRRGGGGIRKLRLAREKEEEEVDTTMPEG